MSQQDQGKKISRRKAISSAAMAFAAAGVAPAVAVGAMGANDAINVGVIGTGKMGRSNMRAFAREDGVRIAAVCDVYRPNLQLALDDLKEAEKPAPREFADFRKLLEMKEIDIVIAATPDHWHPINTVMACRAGKDVYVEKPVSVVVEEGRIMTNVARETGRIVGVGTQQRSGEHFQKAREIVRNGQLGRITKVTTWNYENEYPEGIGYPADCDPPADLDWDMWLGPAPKVPFNWNKFGVVDDGRWSSFRWFWDYAGGMMTDWGTHLLDIVLWSMDVKGPKSVTAFGSKYGLLDNRDTPDTMTAVWDFGKFLCTYENRKCNRHNMDGRGYGIIFHGSEASLFVDRSGYALEPESERVGSETRPRMIPAKGAGSEQHQTHVKAYLDCVKTRKRFISDIEDGHLASVTPHLANVAMRLGRTLNYDPDKEQFIGDSEANAMLRRDYRAPWTLV
ncbi:MAG: Gfo/Idh/MocA family oxidoreductase [Candidatus Glassbacteria bacterium]|nr:Gfo/Idh/MocA family oxidoreductase [Candidatus Glassbacteria bacterium]